MRVLFNLLRARNGDPSQICPGALQAALGGGAVGRLRGRPLPGQFQEGTHQLYSIRGFASSDDGEKKEEGKFADAAPRPTGMGRGRSTVGAFSQFLRKATQKAEPVGQMRKQQKKQLKPDFKPGERRGPPQRRTPQDQSQKASSFPAQDQEADGVLDQMQGIGEEREFGRRPRRQRRPRKDDEKQFEDSLMSQETDLVEQEEKKAEQEEEQEQKELYEQGVKAIEDAATEVERTTLEALGITEEDLKMAQSEEDKEAEPSEEMIAEAFKAALDELRTGSSEDPNGAEIISLLKKEFKESWKDVLNEQALELQNILMEKEPQQQQQLNGGSVWGISQEEGALGDSPHAHEVYVLSRPQTKHPATWPRPMLDILQSEQMPELNDERMEFSEEEKEYMKHAWGQMIKNPSLSEKGRRKMLQTMAEQLGLDREEREKVYREIVLMDIDEEVKEEHYEEAEWEDEEWDLDDEDEEGTSSGDEGTFSGDEGYSSGDEGTYSGDEGIYSEEEEKIYQEHEEDIAYRDEEMGIDEFDDEEDFKRSRRRRRK